MAKKQTTELDIDAWMDEVFAGENLDEHERNLFKKKLSIPVVKDRINAGTMRKSEFSRMLDEDRAERQRLQEEQEQFRQTNEQQLSQYSTWEKDAKAVLEKSEAGRLAALEEKAALEQKLSKLAADGDLDLDELGLKGAKPVDAPPIDTSKFLTREQLEAEIAKLRSGSDTLRPSVEINMKLMDMASEHRRMFGTDLNMDALYQEHIKTGKPLDTVWQTRYKVNDKRQELADAERQRIEDEIRADERKKVIQQMTNTDPFVRNDNVESPALRRFGPSGDSLKDRPAQSAPQRAAARFESERTEKLRQAAAARAARAS